MYIHVETKQLRACLMKKDTLHKWVNKYNKLTYKQTTSSKTEVG